MITLHLLVDSAAFPFCQEKRKKQAGTLSFLIFIAKFGAVAVGSPAETPREIMENITKKLKRAYNPIQLFNSLKTTIMRKNTTGDFYKLNP